MKILALLHGFPPQKNAGAEYYALNLFKYLVSKGHFVTVRIADNTFKPYEIEGIKVDCDSSSLTRKDLLTTDVIITHLNRQGYACNLAEWSHKPCVVIQHNNNVFYTMHAKHKPNAHERWLFAIYNTQVVKDKCKYPNPSIILHPPVYADRVKVTKRGTNITLINCWDKKGGDVFQSIASRMPEQNFLGVKGGYAERHQLAGNFPNIVYLENTSDIKSVYARTRILLMPSVSESYGMAAVEAMASGIPVIASPTPGMKESLKDAAIFVDRDNIDGWVEAIRSLDDKDTYKKWSQAVTARFKEIEKSRDIELAEAEKFLQAIINRAV
jgi:glycosyltransferase involved in cell wall biosynthesis